MFTNTRASLYILFISHFKNTTGKFTSTLANSIVRPVQHACTKHYKGHMPSLPRETRARKHAAG